MSQCQVGGQKSRQHIQQKETSIGVFLELCPSETQTLLFLLCFGLYQLLKKLINSSEMLTAFDDWKDWAKTV